MPSDGKEFTSQSQGLNESSKSTSKPNNSKQRSALGSSATAAAITGLAPCNTSKTKQRIRGQTSSTSKLPPD
eukprot:Skav220233  [mRNA]  locus=scaffold4245:2843:5625:+ [translate_table: standard]